GLKLAGLTAAEASHLIEKEMADHHIERFDIVWILKIESGDRAQPGPISAGDLVRVTFAQDAATGELWCRNLRVDEAGNLAVPFIGDVKVDHMNELQAQEALEKAYLDLAGDGGITQKPFVSILKLPTPQERMPGRP